MLHDIANHTKYHAAAEYHVEYHVATEYHIVLFRVLPRHHLSSGRKGGLPFLCLIEKNGFTWSYFVSFGFSLDII